MHKIKLNLGPRLGWHDVSLDGESVNSFPTRTHAREWCDRMFGSHAEYRIVRHVTDVGITINPDDTFEDIMGSMRLC